MLTNKQLMLDDQHSNNTLNGRDRDTFVSCVVAEQQSAGLIILNRYWSSQSFLPVSHRIQNIVVSTLFLDFDVFLFVPLTTVETQTNNIIHCYITRSVTKIPKKKCTLILTNHANFLASKYAAYQMTWRTDLKITRKHSCYILIQK